MEHPGDRQYVITLDEGSEETIEQKNTELGHSIQSLVKENI